MPHKAALITGANCNEAEAQKLSMKLIYNLKSYLFFSLKPQNENTLANEGHIFSVDQVVKWVRYLN